jgi:SHS2 domain-containing protein
MKKFEFLEHTADIKFRAYGKSISDAFENSASALVSYLAGDEKIASKKRKTINVHGNDYESLLYNFLDELLYLLDSEGFVVSKSEIKINKFNLEAKLYGDSAKNYSLDHIKAATYAEMYVKKVKPKQKNKGNERWKIQAVLDV